MARALLARGDAAAAEQLSRALIAARYYHLQRPDEMLQGLAQMELHAKDFPAACLTIGDFYSRLGNEDAAIREFREGIAKDARQKSTYQKRIVEIFLRQGKRDEAARMNAEILKTDPNDADARSVAAALLLDRGETDRAIAQLQGVVGRAPDSPVAHFSLGRGYAARNEWALAAQEFQRAVEIRPGYLIARLALAQLQLRQREWDGALRGAEQILATDPNNMSAGLIESAALIGEKRFPESRVRIDEMLKMAPNSSDVHYQLGVWNLAEKRYPEAEEAFHRSYELNPAGLDNLAFLLAMPLENGHRREYNLWTISICWTFLPTMFSW